MNNGFQQMWAEFKKLLKNHYLKFMQHASDAHLNSILIPVTISFQSAHGRC